MTDTQLGALIIAGGFVGAVYAYNLWQEYRYKKQANKAFARNQDDVLINTPKNMVRQGDSQRLEPVLVGAAAGEDHEVAQIDEDQYAPSKIRYDEDMPDDIPDLPPSYHLAYASEPQYQPDVAGYTPDVALDNAELDEIDEGYPIADEVQDTPALSLIDSTLDFIAEIESEQPIMASDLPPFPASKRVQIIGLNQLSQWEVVNTTSRNRYQQLRIALQLADRQGPISQESLNAFYMGVQQFADEQGASVVFPQKSAKLAAAQALDEFCASVDVLIGLNLPAGARPIPMEKVRLHAEQIGMVRANDGTFQYRNAAGKLLFVLANQDQTPLMATSKGLTLLFDVPRVPGGLPVFDALVDFAQSLSNSLGLALVDDNGKALNPQSLANIRTQLAELYERMDERGIVPGSATALRLFA
ncbi:cell division protein ZipA C-terminal FtsZ-binding domain-containing protein [Chitinibacter sp. S2-10]|uniref:cell division protein ZipA C-terminal FtsZ-binding domain-containing protein n=1 Tax=Chitinibacter sp. S2-10 TaxID=3373597 RepID=UPI0039774A0E